MGLIQYFKWNIRGGRIFLYKTHRVVSFVLILYFDTGFIIDSLPTILHHKFRIQFIEYKFNIISIMIVVIVEDLGWWHLSDFILQTSLLRDES